MSSALAFFIEAIKLAIVTIILWFVCELLPMTPPWKRVVQTLIVLLAILAAISMVLAGEMRTRVDRSMSMDRVPGLLGGVPNIMTPEKR